MFKSIIKSLFIFVLGSATLLAFWVIVMSCILKVLKYHTPTQDGCVLFITWLVIFLGFKLLIFICKPFEPGIKRILMAVTALGIVGLLMVLLIFFLLSCLFPSSGIDHKAEEKALESRLSSIVASGVNELEFKEFSDFDWDEAHIDLPYNYDTYKVDWSLKKWTMRFKSKSGPNRSIKVNRDIIDLKPPTGKEYSDDSYYYDKNTKLKLITEGRSTLIVLDREKDIGEVTKKDIFALEKKLRRIANSGAKEISFKDLIDYDWDTFKIYLPRNDGKVDWKLTTWSLDFKRRPLWSSRYFSDIPRNVIDIKLSKDLLNRSHISYCYSRDKILKLHGKKRKVIVLDAEGELCNQDVKTIQAK